MPRSKVRCRPDPGMVDGFRRIRERDRSLERAVIDFVEAMVLRPHVGERFDAVVTDLDTARDRGRVQLHDPAVVAHLPARGLTLGQRVTVRLDGVDPDRRRVEFSLAD